ncbi:hypothetical protein SADUNF_Sadunf08G0044600 [Salix dunnii]|uniref:Uncharacterized protein n=1 Tax=Salix dunnii TaxID=1413687 RepID=A0A835MTC1_9ROSI|nr:hypothetical protein SADUNF_Sadunf08G0044600 [Salix dunnii]
MDPIFEDSEELMFQLKSLSSFRFVNCKGLNELIYEIKGKVTSKFLTEVKVLDGFYFVNRS